MSAPDYSNAWLHVAGWLAVELVLVAGLLLGASRCAASAAWRRMFCQAALVAAMALIVGELSGAARLAAWQLGKCFGHGMKATGAAAAHGAAPVVSPSKTLAAVTPVVRASSTADEPSSPTAELVRSLPRQAATGPVVPPAAHLADQLPSFAAGRPGGRFPWLCFCWGVGVLVVVGRAWGGRLLLFLHGLRPTGKADAKLNERVAQLALRLGLRRRVCVLRSIRAASPMAYGWLRPTVVLPSDFESRFNAPQQEVVLAHEVAHLAAHDPLWGWLADGVTALLWWHPTAWWLRREFHNASESAADEASLLVAGGPKALAECLIELGSRLLEVAPAGHLGMAGFRSHLGRRVQSLLRLEDRPWSPPPPRRALAVQVFGAAAAVAVAISTTAWASPRALIQGETINTMKLNWKQTLAAFGLVAAVATPDRLPAAETAAPSPAPPPAESSPAAVTAPAGSQTFTVQDNAQARPVAGTGDGQAAVTQPPALTKGQAHALGDAHLTKVVEPQGVSDGSPPGSNCPSLTATGSSSLSYQWYFVDSNTPAGSAQPSAPSGGLSRHPAPGPTAPAAQRGASAPSASLAGHKSTGKERLEALLRSTVIDVGPWSGLPLSEVIRVLNDQSQRQDPAKSGVNFLLNQGRAPIAQGPAPAIDPATGLPLQAAPVEQVDLAAVAIEVRFPLRQITMLDALDAIVKSADHPIRYTLEDYAVVFSPAPPRTVPDAELGVRTFKLEKEALIEGLQSAFGISLGPLAQDSGARSRQYQTALRSWLTALNTPVEGRGSVFYNETTGILMVRASPQDLQIIEAAVETLGGAKAGTGGKQGF